MLLILPLICFLHSPQDIQAMDRDVQIQGFNGAKLGASIKAAENPSPWFAVLVQDAGLTDRNGQNRSTPKAQTGLAIAELLKSVGIGSLRYDKRLVGARDPKLDVSLDAQLGDLSAVISAARSQPETKNKKILLVGHGEGALFALLAASQAEALLMLAPPSGTMAKTIRSQAEAQLPASIKVANLAYLDSVFQAIRDGGPVPEATAGIHAAMSQMGRSLMAPETLGFVKSTLDIDPWAIASRLSIPNAAVWGGKDVITFKPAGIEGFYKGANIDVPNANHHFRQELRPKDGLDGASAASAYSDDAPMADLSAVAAWIKSLPQ
jgi:pimeloyl-ACP methyl ester carboxylesterase